MKQISFVVVLVLLGISAGFAQPKQEWLEKIRKIKTAYITEQIDLTKDQASRFWPVYHQYESERRDIRRRYYREYREKEGMDRKTARKHLEVNLEYQEEELNLKKKYKVKLLAIISQQQLVDLYQAEQGFRKILMDELKERRQSQQKK